jgi:hypothetical protein
MEKIDDDLAARCHIEAKVCEASIDIFTRSQLRNGQVTRRIESDAGRDIVRVFPRDKEVDVVSRKGMTGWIQVPERDNGLNIIYIQG